jgi:nucleoside-diphosphate-sugar epimerase
MKVLITGAAGFIGSHTAERLHSMGHKVLGVDNFSDYYSIDLKERNKADLSAQGIDVHRLDLRYM